MPPQSDEDIQRFVGELRVAVSDPLLDIRWNPKAVMVAPGRYDGFGVMKRGPVYDGRWEVIRHDTAASLHLERDFTVIVQLNGYESFKGSKRTVLFMHAKGPYTPVDRRLIDYMEQCNAANVAFHDQLLAMDEMDAAAEREDVANVTAAHQQAAEVVYRKVGGRYWMGGAQGKSAPDTERALWPATTR